MNSNLLEQDDFFSLAKDYKLIYEFVYDKGDGSSPKWRRIGVVESDDEYISGFDLEDRENYKCFNISKIVGGKNKIFITYV
jgi:hypothetical protein